MKIVTLFVLAMLARPALAGDEPWAVGVTDTQKKAAQALLEQGNALFLDRSYGEALEKYKAAVVAWDHPAIRFNMVRCLIQLERPVEASDSLARALQYGAAPLDDAVYTEALSYQKLLASQIGDLEVSCTQAGVKISLDGQPLIEKCPGKERRRATVGEHLLVGTKHGFLTKTTEVIVAGSKEQRVEVALVSLDTAATVTHRWPGWVPWSVFGGGLAIAGIGGLVQLQSSSRMDSYDRQVTRQCSMVQCDPNDTAMLDTTDKDSAERLNTIAIGVMSAGAAVVIAGGVMLYLNRGRTVYEKSNERVAPKAARIDVVPRQGGGLVIVAGSF